MQTDQGLPSNKSNMPIVELDDFDIDGLGFKPINKGLGFHGEREAKVQKRTTLSSKHNRNFSNASSLNTKLNHTAERVPLNNPLGGIEHFYNAGKTANDISIAKKVEVLSEDISEAKLIARMGAYLIDCVVVFAISLFVFGLFVLTLYSAVGSSLIQTFVSENLDFFMLLNGVIYISYFSLWDAVGTLGKILMGIEVVSQDKDSYLSMTQLFNRSILSLFGLFLFFLPNILDVHAKLSRTLTVEK